MTRLSWNSAGKRYYETGCDRGVLYVDDNPGVPWIGLVSVSEEPTGGEPRPYYQDGQKYLNLTTAEEFEATINAFSAPPEFGPCDGVQAIGNGLFVTQQRRKSFGFSYRTLIGNDVDAKSHGYKIHLVYNALAEPASRTNSTVSSDVSLNELSWHITTLPPAMSGFRPTAHLVIDSRDTDPSRLSIVEDVLYGDNFYNARLPEFDELVTLFS